MSEAIKLCFLNKIKRVPVQSSFLTLTQTICDSFLINNNHFSQYYLDDEKDHILIENESDYHMALKFAKEAKSTLKIFIEFPEDTTEFDHKTSLIQQETIDYSAPEEQTLDSFECKTCSRKFSSSRSYGAHSKVCLKLFKQKATKFDTNKMRLKGIAVDNGIDIETLKNKSNSELLENKQEQLMECKICSRKFNKTVFNKHLIYCRKKIKRVSFDSKKQRAYWLKNNSYFFFSDEKQKTKKNKQKKNWKKKSEKFRSIIHIAREMMKNE